MIFKLLTEHHLEFLSLKGGCRGSSESTLVKRPHFWKSHAVAHISLPNICSECTDHFHCPLNSVYYLLRLFNSFSIPFAQIVKFIVIGLRFLYNICLDC